MVVIFLVVFLYCMEEVREITLSALIFESWAMMSSVMPSLKYSFSGSVLMFSNGSTATDFAAVTSCTIACAAPTAMATVAGVPSASANWAAVENRSAGMVAIAFFTAASTASGTSSRTARGDGTGELSRLAMTAMSVDPAERRLAHQHLEQHAAQAVDVAPAVEVLDSLDLLRAHVGRRADDVRRSEDLRRADRPGDAEVRHQRVARVQQDVRGLDVPVHHLGAVRVAQRVGDLARDLERVVDRQLALPGQALAQRLALDVGHDVVHQAVGLVRVVERKDVGMVEPGRDLNLAQEPGGARSPPPARGEGP